MCAACKINSCKNTHKYCNGCAPNISIYRSRASFRFNVYDFPSEFDLLLIETHGWYSPNGYKRRNKKPNLNGVSRDHIYSVKEGFVNGVDPEILAHPANCKIMIHNGPSGNNSKHSESEMTLAELERRIEEWERKYSESPQI